MSADIKAATEIAERNRYANTTFGDLSNAFLEVTAELEQERKAREKADQFAAEETLRCLEAEQRTAELQARLDRVEAHAEALAFALDGMSADTNTALPQAFHDYRQRALAAAVGQESAATTEWATTPPSNEGVGEQTQPLPLVADPALPGLEILASHSGKSQNREWHSVGTWLYPGEAIYEGTPK